jgi:hypothetical protein
MELSELSLSGGNGACFLRCGHWSSGQPSLRSKHSVEGRLPSCDVTRHDESDPRVHAGMRIGSGARSVLLQVQGAGRVLGTRRRKGHGRMEASKVWALVGLFLGVAGAYCNYRASGETLDTTSEQVHMRLGSSTRINRWTRLGWGCIAAAFICGALSELVS